MSSHGGGQTRVLSTQTTATGVSAAASNHSAGGGGGSSGYSTDPHDLDDIIERLHIGTLKREKLKARRSILVDEDTPPLTQHEAEELARSETYSITSEDSYNDRKTVRRKTSGSSRDSGAYSLGTDPSPKPQRQKPSKPAKVTKEQEVQTSIGKTFNYNKLSDVYAAEEGVLSHGKDQTTTEKSQHKGVAAKMSKLFSGGKSMKHKHTDDNHNSVPGGGEVLNLPQTFLVKYMGSKPTRGYGGTKYIQTPVEELVNTVNDMPRGTDLPLVKLEVTLDGLNMNPHRRNKVKSFEAVTIPIQYISYGAQDQNYPRIFCFIMVREMSARNRKLDCHVYACDSSKSARKAAACLALTFAVYQEKMEGKPPQFSAPVSQTEYDDDDDIKSSYDV